MFSYLLNLLSSERHFFYQKEARSFKGQAEKAHLVELQSIRSIRQYF